MGKNNFFNKQTEFSEVKSRIVEKYFNVWANIFKKRSGGLNYIDLFSGPGKYNDESESTPLFIARRVIDDSYLSKKLLMVFNDKDKDIIGNLESEIKGIPNFSELKNAPIFLNENADEFQTFFDGIRLAPTLSFIDPFGYKGVSLDLIYNLTKNHGCDCILFFNYNRVNMGIKNPRVSNHMNALFGECRANKLKSDLSSKPKNLRQAFILEEFTNALRDKGINFVLPFIFRKQRNQSQMLIFASKKFIAYNIMKEIMAKESNDETGEFVYSQADETLPTLNLLIKPIELEKLGNDLLTEFAEKEIAFQELFEKHSVGTPYLEKDYKDILKKLEKSGKVEVMDPEGKRKACINTLAKRVSIKFL